MRDALQPSKSAGLVDVLDRVLDKGLVIAGDIKVSLAEVELLTIRIRLLVCSLDKAQEIGLDWWKYDRNLSRGTKIQDENDDLRRQIDSLRQKVALLTHNSAIPGQRALTAAASSRSRSRNKSK